MEKIVATLACEVCGNHAFGNRLPCKTCGRQTCASCGMGNRGECKECFVPNVMTGLPRLVDKCAGNRGCEPNVHAGRDRDAMAR